MSVLQSLAMPAPVFRILAGPTASGKSATAHLIALEQGADIVSIDSMKIYSELNIGTAKPSAGERAEVHYHLIGIRDPWQNYSVAEFVRNAEELIAGAKKPLIGEGGTALYLKALSEGLFEGPGRDLELRTKLEHEAETHGLDQLFKRLQEHDPAAAKKILPSDKRRIIRALEVLDLTGKPISEWQTQWGAAREDLDIRIACLALPRKILYQRIDARVNRMLANGWLEECKRLLELPQPLSREASQALGYRTLFAHLRGEMSLDAATERICFDTHHFARRQINWFRRLPKTSLIELSGEESSAEIAERVLKVW